MGEVCLEFKQKSNKSNYKKSLIQSLIDTMRVKTGGRKKGTPNKISSQVKEKLTQVIQETIHSLDISLMRPSEKIKLIQIGLQYIIPKPQLIEEPQEEQKFTVEIIDNLSKYSDKQLDNAIKL